MASLETALEAVDTTLEKIKNLTRIALVSNPEHVVRSWRGELSRRLLISQDALPLVYCCNDILQESKGQINELYRKHFAEVLEEDLKSILREKPESLDLIKKVITVWAERQVFDKPFMRKLRGCLHSVTKEETAESIIEEESKDDEVSEKMNPIELQRIALESLSLPKLIALLSDLQEQNAKPEIAENEVNQTLQESKNLLNFQVDSHALGNALSKLHKTVDTLKRKRRSKQGLIPVCKAARLSLEKSIQRAEESLQSASEDVTQAERLTQVFEVLSAHTTSSNLEAHYSSLRLIPKREKVEDKAINKDKLPKEATNDANKAERPTIFHKGLQKWVALPQGDESDAWRD